MKRKRPARWNQRPRPNTALIAKAAIRKLSQRQPPSGSKP